MYAMDKKLILSLILLYLIFSIICIFFYAPFHDTLYYWDWGRHEALSYFDGPPLIAYLIRAFTFLLGTSSFSLNLTGFICDLMIAFFIYRLALLLFDKHLAIFATLVWLLSSSTFIQYNLKVEYDTPVTLFWIITIYCFSLAHFKKQLNYLYLAGISAGLMMLSKYTGILLYLSIFIMMLLSKNYRYLFKNKEVYFSILLSLLLFSPVIIWNFQHHFASFFFQLHHGFKHKIQMHQFFEYITLTFTMYHVIFLLFIYFILMNIKKVFTDPKLEILIYPAMITFLFFFFVSPYSYKNNWNDTFYITGSILVSYFLMQRIQWKKVTLMIFGINLLIIGTITLVVINKGNVFHSIPSYGAYKNKSAIMNIKKFYHPGDYVFTDRYTLAAELAFYLPHQPYIYSLYFASHQYYYWSQHLIPEIKENKIKKALYITRTDQVDLGMLQYFDDCVKLNQDSVKLKSIKSLNVFECYNKIRH